MTQGHRHHWVFVGNADSWTSLQMSWPETAFYLFFLIYLFWLEANFTILFKKYIVVVFAIHHHELAMSIHVSRHPESSFHLPPDPIPLSCPRAPALGTLLHASNLHWSSILHMGIYMFQCYSLRSSHPCLLLHSSKVCSLYPCLFCCLVYRVIVTIFLNSIYIP